jgi:hypothetical protein
LNTTDALLASQNALLVAVPIKMRGLSAKSDLLTDEAVENHEADINTYNMTVKLLSKEALKGIIRVRNAAKEFHIANTLPWADTGLRMIPVGRYAHWKRELTRKQNEFFDETQLLFDDYLALRKEYIRRATPEVAKEIPFPTLEQLKSNFDFRLFEQPIADLSDFRLKLVDEKTVASLKATMTASITAILDEGHLDIINRLAKVVSRLHDQTAKENGRMFESLVTNIEEAVDVLPSLNLRNDPEIARLINRVKNELATIDVTALRVSPSKMTDAEQAAINAERAKINKVAGAVLKDIKGYTINTKPKPKTTAAAKTIVATVTAPAKKRRSAFASVNI